MPEIIAGAYEVLGKLGSGGGGTVYLANHLRMNQRVVLKADKREVTTSPALLRREVDILKELRHPNIPIVYDFFEENGVVYTVMDYIDGESLNHPLMRGERFPQPTVIQWAKQLLEALCYLHSPTHGDPPRGYVHSDIKPANLMLRGNGDLCLIDFNVSLALGVDCVIGASAGYASPEHYGLDFSSGSTATQGGTLTMRDETATVTMLDASARRSRKIVPDVRSDIYSVGATLYHLLSGRKPARDAPAVVPLTAAEASPPIAAILAKAMRPNPELRYQSAAEMLEAFRRLHEDDPRTKALRRQARVTAGVLSALFLSGAVCGFTGLRQLERLQAEARLAAEQAEEAERTEKEALAAVSGSEEALRRGDKPNAVRLAAQALQMDSRYAARAQAALTDALGVYDLTDGLKLHRRIELPAAPIQTAFSPQGTRIAVVADGQALVFDTESGEGLAALPAAPSAQADAVFSGEDTLVYAGAETLCAYDLAQGRALWTGEAATEIALSADGATAAAVCEDHAAVYDVKDGTLLQTVPFDGRSRATVENDVFADAGDHLFRLNADGSRLAVSFTDGSLEVFDLRGRENDLELFDASAFTRFEGGFYGDYFAFSASGAEESVFAVVDVERMEQTGGSASTVPYHVQADESGIYISQENVLVRIHPVTGAQEELAYTGAEITGFAVGDGCAATAGADGSFSVFGANAGLIETREDGERCDFVLLAGEFAAAANRDVPALRLLKRESRRDAQRFDYDPAYPHDEARISADGETAMLFRYDGFRVYGANGLLAEGTIPDAGQVRDQQFRRDGSGSRLEVFYNDGLVRSYSASDGSLLSERAEEPASDSLDEEFLTDRLRIVAPLHGTPVAYDRETGEIVRELESDGYLAYAAQCGEYVVTMYATTAFEHYGLLLNEACETVARLPGLCDVTPDGTLVFDDQLGNLRSSRIYSIENLLAIAGE